MQEIFIFIAILGLLYFGIVKRRFDFFSLAYLSACIYFLPGFFGYALEPRTPNISIRQVSLLVNETYLVMSTVLIAITFGGIFYDLKPKKYKSRFKLKNTHYTTWIAFTIAIFGFFASLVTIGLENLLNPDKSTLISQLNRWHLIWTVGASIATILSFLEKRWLIFIGCIVLLLFDLYIGFRHSLAITLLSLFSLWSHDQGRQRIVQNSKAILGGLAIAFTLFIYKFLYVAIKRGNWHLVGERLSDLDFYEKAITQSEPFTTQVILNSVIQNNLHVGINHFKNLVYQLTFFSNNLGTNSVASFNDLFQPILFPTAISGMANNIWAEMWSSGGWLLLLAFIIVFVIILFFGSYYLGNSDPVVKGGLTSAMTYWAFYIHRNDLMYQITLEKRVIVFWCIFVIFSMFISFTRSRNI